MCGRYRLTLSDIDFLKEFYGIEDIANLPTDAFVSYNIAPQSFQPIVRLNPAGKRELALLRWGFVPSGASDAKKYHINAKAETIYKLPTFRNAFRFRRCIVLTDGIYEWETLANGRKQAYAIGMKSGEPMALAGIWESWHDPAINVSLETYAVITTEPNSLMEKFHKRMAAILRREDFERWLAPADENSLPFDLLRPFDPELMTAWPIGPEIGRTENNRPELLKPIDPEPRLFPEA
jgi:putative SOS response-associated peptidase YedK